MMPVRPTRAVVTAFLLGGASLLAQSQQPADAILVLDAPGISQEAAVVWRQSSERGAELVAVRTEPGSTPGRLTVRIPCVPGDYVVQTSSRVSTPFGLDAADCSRPRQVRLLPSAGIRGRIVLPADSSGAPASIDPSTPQAVLAFPVRNCEEQGRGEDIGQYRVRAAEDGRFALVVPSGCLAVGLRMAPFAPVPRAPVTLKPGEVHDLGTLELRTGATLVVNTRIGEGPGAGASVSVLPDGVYEEALINVFSRIISPGGTTTIANRAGIAAFVGLPPLPVSIVATAKDRIGVAGPVELSEGEERDVDGLQLFAAGRANIALLGDLNAVRGRLSLVAVPPPAAAGMNTMVVLTQEALATGTAGVQIPIPGRWAFELRADDTLLDRQVVDCLPEATVSVQFSVDRQRFAGRVFVGDAPVAGALSLVAEATGEPAGRADTDSDGRFTVALQGPGRYTAFFSREQDGIQHARATAEFAAGREAVVRLAVTNLEGAVAFADGRPAGEATVTAERLAEHREGAAAFNERQPSVTSDATGRFALRCLEAGVYDVSASLASRKSESRRVSVGDAATAPVQLVLPDADGLTVRFLNARGEGVPRVSGWLMAPSGESGGMPQAMPVAADDEGTAKAAVAWSAASSIHVVIADLEHPVMGFRATPGEDGVLSLALASAPGQLRITFPRIERGHAGESDVSAAVLVGDRGALIPLSLLTEMGVAKEVNAPGSTAVIIPQLASGQWRLARFADVRAMLSSFSNGPAPEILRSFSLLPGGSVSVDLR